MIELLKKKAQPKKVFWRFLGLFLCLELPLSVYADMTGVYSLKDEKNKDTGTMTIQYRDAQHIRYDIKGKKPDEAGTLLLVKDKLYAITPQGEVMDMAMVAGIAGALGKVEVTPKKPAKFSLDATGKVANIAGIQGEVYRWSDGTRSGEAVLSKDPRAKQLSEAMERIGDHMEQALGSAQASATFREMRDHPALRDKGFVSSKDDAGSSMRLESIQNAPLSDGLFVLPKKANAGALPGMPNGIPDMNDPQIQMLMKEMMKQQGH